MMSVLLHGHHERLLTFEREYAERLAQIRSIKPADELPTRERFMRVLTDAELTALPPDFLPPVRAYYEAERVYYEAERAYDEAERAYDEAERVYYDARAYDEARRAYYEVRRVYYEARRAYDEARRAYYKAKQEPLLEAWHRQVCSADCPATASNNWSIFGGAKR
jgi:tetratricopeptide (TPR) repeat protein